MAGGAVNRRHGVGVFWLHKTPFVVFDKSFDEGGGLGVSECVEGEKRLAGERRGVRASAARWHLERVGVDVQANIHASGTVRSQKRGRQH